MSERSTIFVGKKPVMGYAIAILSAVGNDTATHITLKARGRSITTAVDAAEIVRHHFLPNGSVAKVSIGTEQVKGEDSITRNVSAIEITLALTQDPAAQRAGSTGQTQRSDYVNACAL